MKKILVSALAAGLFVVPLANAEAYHIIKQHQDDPVVAARPVAEEQNAAAPEPVPTTGIKPQIKEYDAQGHEIKSARGTLNQLHAQAGTVANRAYKMRGGDQVEIKMLNLSGNLGAGNGAGSNGSNNDLTMGIPGVYLVRNDGYMTLPLLGDIDVLDKTVPEVTQEIVKGLDDYLYDPQVTMNILKMGYTRVYVMGEITRQGAFKLEERHTLLDAVAAAGGFTEKSAKREVYVVRENLPNFVVKVNMLELMTKNNQNCNPVLQDGDMVYISSNHKLGMFGILNFFSKATDFASDVKYLRN